MKTVMLIYSKIYPLIEPPPIYMIHKDNTIIIFFKTKLFNFTNKALLDTCKFNMITLESGNT